MEQHECKHGRLARKCEICEYEREIVELRNENKKLLWAKEEQLQALADVINAAASETNALNRARLILAKNRGEADNE